MTGSGRTRSGTASPRTCSSGAFQRDQKFMYGLLMKVSAEPRKYDKIADGVWGYQE
jgi:hypothetical protein